jgi:hypothetical protein
MLRGLTRLGRLAGENRKGLCNCWNTPHTQTTMTRKLSRTTTYNRKFLHRLKLQSEQLRVQLLRNSKPPREPNMTQHKQEYRRDPSESSSSYRITVTDERAQPHILKVASEDPDTMYASLGASPTHCTAPSCAAQPPIYKRVAS